MPRGTPSPPSLAFPMRPSTVLGTHRVPWPLAHSQNRSGKTWTSGSLRRGRVGCGCDAGQGCYEDPRGLGWVCSYPWLEFPSNVHILDRTIGSETQKGLQQSPRSMEEKGALESSESEGPGLLGASSAPGLTPAFLSLSLIPMAPPRDSVQLLSPSSAANPLSSVQKGFKVVPAPGGGETEQGMGEGSGN